jgi:hypothetical protein
VRFIVFSIAFDNARAAEYRVECKDVWKPAKDSAEEK